MKLNMKHAIGLALLRRPWASRLALAWGVRRALRVAGRSAGSLSFLGGVGVGAGLMYWVASHTAEPQPRRTARTARPQASRRPRVPARSKSPAR